MNMKPLFLTAAMISVSFTAGTIQAQTVTADMQVTITIEDACEISTAPTVMDFGTHGVLSTVIDTTSDFEVTCTTGAAYDIGLNGGASGDVDARTMTDGTDFVEYQLYQETGYNTVWGDTISTNTVASVGTGAAQSFTAYGRVPVQDTPPAGTYTDTVTVTVSY